MIIAAFEGWNDAGEAASGVINHLNLAWQATPVGAIDPEDYYDFQVTRPVTEVAEGRTERLIWPTTRLLTAKQEASARDLVLVHGIEPNMRWRGFCSELVTEACVAAGLLGPERTRPAATYPCDLFYGRSWNLFIDRHLDVNAGWCPPARWTSHPYPGALAPARAGR